MRLSKLRQIIVTPMFARALMRYRVAASVEHSSALRELHCRTVVDIGANRGQFSLLSRCLFPTAMIFSFEPLPQAREIYSRLFKSDPCVTLYPVAVGKNSETRVMHLSARNDSSSLLPIGEWQTLVFPGTHAVGVLEVDVKPLYQVISAEDIQAPALLKLDVQGFELDALRGCTPMLERFDYVYCECSFVEMYKGQSLADEIIAWMRDQSFCLDGVYNTTYSIGGKAIQADFLFNRVTSI